jgi:hypothetical protein
MRSGLEVPVAKAAEAGLRRTGKDAEGKAREVAPMHAARSVEVVVVAKLFPVVALRSMLSSPNVIFNFRHHFLFS